ncbi:MAG: EAL domain-containing protein [Rhodocyclaceae bacterium]|nr:EAL domain-containing protein [Rhodocyclaceae bacterium]
MAWVALALGLALSFLGWRAASQKTHELADSRFQARAQELHQALQARLDAYSQALRGAQAYAGSVGRPNRTDFSRLSAILRFDNALPGIAAFSYLTAVPGRDRESFLRALKKEYPDFEIRPGGERDEYVVVTTAAPETPDNRRAIGSDSFASRTRREAITAARDSGETRITAKLNLVMDLHDAPPAFLMYQAVYRNAELPTSVDDRRAKIAGYFVSAFRVDALIAAVVGGRHRDIAIRVYDGFDRRDENLYFASHPGRSFIDTRHSLSATVEVGGRSWLVEYAALPEFNVDGDGRESSFRLLAAGIIVSLLLASIVWSLASTRERALSLARDMTRSLRESETTLRALFEQAPFGIALIDSNGRIIDCNDMIAAYIGAQRHLIIGFSMLDDARDQVLREPLLKAIGGSPVAFEGAYTPTTGNRSSHYSWHLQPVRLDDDRSFVLCFVEDINERKLAEAHIEHLAHHDTLTGLANRAVLKDRLQQAIATAARTDTQVALMYIDLDFFKHINDTLGHSVGDAMLVEIAQRLRGCVRESDTLARIGGDEFVVLLTNIRGEQDCARVAENIITAIGEPISVDTHVFNTSASIGIAIWPDDGADHEVLTSNADVAMYHAKSSGRNNYQFFTADMNRRAQEAAAMERSLRDALRAEQFVLEYQPQVDAASGRVIGAEALIRWHHPELGLLSPARFIHVAEERGLIGQIGDWVLHSACRQAQAWREAGFPELQIAVNISPRQFRKSHLGNCVRDALAASALPPHLLALEITESVVMDDIEMAKEMLGDLRTLGVQIEIDDFGTGHSSLAYLKLLPIHRLKIDRGFVNDIPGDSDDTAIVEAIINLAQSLKLGTIAEGVETEAQRQFLLARGCRAMQGHFFARALPAEGFLDYLRQHGTV